MKAIGNTRLKAGHLVAMTLIWVIVGIINVAHAMRQHPQQ